MKRSLSGIKSTGTPHLGNYLGMIKPAIELQKTHDTFYFIADLHALTSVRDPKAMIDDSYEIAAQFLAFGFDPSKGALFRQSDIPEVSELSWLLSCVAPMGDLFRAHAFKAAKDAGVEGEMNLGTFSYPVLMAADILIYDSDVVPVGKDQLQHLEMTREVGRRFNHAFGSQVFKEPKELIREDVAVVPGTDGRKMSKSYNNGIEPLSPPKKLKQQIGGIVTDSKGLEDVKDPDTDNIVKLYKLFATPIEVKAIESKYRAGNYGYGHAKQELTAKMESIFGPVRVEYERLKADRKHLESVLQAGAAKARPLAQATLERAKLACGLKQK